MAIVYKKFQNSDYVILVKKGKVINEGKGLTVLCDDMRTNIEVVPAIAYDGAFGFEDIITADFQSVFVQGVITYIINDFMKAANTFDFGFNRNYENKKTVNMDLICKRINNVIKAIVIREVGSRNIRDIIRLADEMSLLITNGLKEDEVIADLGVKILAINVLGINAKPETRKALEAVAREEILKEQDDAIYKRRNAAIEQERYIKENELNTEIKVAEKEKEKKDAELDIEEMEKQRRIKLDMKDMEAKIDLENENKKLVQLESENDKVKADVDAYAVEKLLKAYENVNVALIEALAMGGMDPSKLMAKAFVELGENAAKIGTVNMTPDLLQSIIDR
ncbi:MAG: hypothetical protein IJ619_07915 [Eubacterium sp.]|nr:hypothetical protein [Eubacterium sp.]